MAFTLASDTFSRANQSGWGTSSGGQSWNSVRGSGTYSISSNEGVNSGNSGTFSINRLGSGTATTTEILVRLQPADTSSDIGTVARFVDSNNFYYGVLVGGVARIGKDVSGSFTTLASTSVTYDTSHFYWLKFNLVGTNLRLKFWQDGSSEPSSWTVTTTDSSLSSGGYGLGSDASGSTSFDSLTVTDATVQKDISTRFRLALLKDIATRFRLRSADQLKDVATRFRLRSADQQKDISSRFRLALLKDIASRFRLRSADQPKDISTRFRLALLKDISTRFRLALGKDISTRFRLMSSNQQKDIASRFRLMSADQVKDISSRFRLRSADQLKDITSRFRLMSANQPKDITSRFRLMSASQLKDVTTRFRLMSASQLRDISTRFRLMSANQLKDISTRFRIMSANRLKDISTRFILTSGTTRTKDISTRFILTVATVYAVGYGRDGYVVGKGA